MIEWKQTTRRERQKKSGAYGMMAGAGVGFVLAMFIQGLFISQGETDFTTPVLASIMVLCFSTAIGSFLGHVTAR